MGRRPIGKRAMSGAERIRRWREKHPKKPTPEKGGIAAALLRARVHELEGELELERQRRKEAEDRLLTQTMDFRAELARRQSRAARPPLPPDEARDRRIRALTTQVRNLRQHIARLINSPRFKTIRMSAQLVREMRSALHPDRAAGDPKRRRRLEQLSQEFNSFTFVHEEKI
jgi:hypothetical protein